MKKYIEEERENDFYKLKEKDNFIDSELDLGENKLNINIIGDHVYTLDDHHSQIVIAADMGNGHGKVIDVVKY